MKAIWAMMLLALAVFAGSLSASAYSMSANGIIPTVWLDATETAAHYTSDTCGVARYDGTPVPGFETSGYVPYIPKWDLIPFQQWGHTQYCSVAAGSSFRPKEY